VLAGLSPDWRTSTLALVTALAAAALVLLEPDPVRAARDRALDAVATLWAPAMEPQVAVVDIDAEALAAAGPWPWPRAVTAELIEKIAAAGPKVIALDLVLAGRCEAEDEANRRLARAIAMAPATLGFVLTDSGAGTLGASHVALRQPVSLAGLWQSAGAELPCPVFLDQARGSGTVSLAGDNRALIRAVPAVVLVGRTLQLGLAVDALRIARDAGMVVVGGGRDPLLSAGGLAAPMGRDGQFRLAPSQPAAWAARTLSAGDVMAKGAPDLAGRIVFLGSSVPQLGTLRPTAASPLTPSVQIHADIATAILTGTLPWRPAMAPVAEAATLMAGAALALWAALRLRPGTAALATLALVLLAIAAAALARYGGELLIDPVWPPAGIAASALAAGLSQFAATRAAALRMRRSFEQRLPPAVVARLVAARGEARLAQEERVVTALFTDIENFTGMTAAAGPETLVRLLDPYFAGLARIVIDHGGMLDKIVGDGAHAFFNMPLDLEGHQARALACAEALLLFSEDYRGQAEAKTIGFGRTRIGIECGRVVVGDIGAGGKIDYSAHGDAVNLAARLQEANKITGTSILAGPGMAAAAPPGWSFQSLGSLDMRGLGPVEVFLPSRAAPAPVG
jgi:adenylate cyclase